LLPNITGIGAFAVVAVADMDLNALHEARRVLRDASLYETVGEMLETADLDAVIISAPPRAQVELAGLALGKGLHVFVEKPVGVAARPVAMLAEKADANQLVAMCGLMWRYAPTSLILDRWRDGGREQPSLINVSATFPAAVKRVGWEMSTVEVALFDMFIHPVDWAVGLLGGEVHGVSATMPLADEDTGSIHTHICLENNSGAVASLALATGSAGYQVAAWIQFRNGPLAEIEDHDHIRITSQPTWTGTEGSLRDRPTLDWRPGQLYRGWARKGYAEELRDFARAVRGGAQPHATLGDTVVSMDVLCRIGAILRGKHP
jgi:predicted dehydrogenase